MADLSPLNLQIVNPSGHGTIGSGNGGGPPMDHDYATKAELQLLSSKMELNFHALNDRLESFEVRLDERTKASQAQFQAQQEASDAKFHEQARLSEASFKAQMAQIEANEKASQAELDRIDQVAKERNQAIDKQFAWINKLLYVLIGMAASIYIPVFIWLFKYVFTH